MTKLISIIALLLCISTAAMAINISGKLTDRAGKPLADATVALYTVGSGSKFVGGSTSNTDGTFTITDVAAGSYILKLNLLGYREQISETILVVAASTDMMLPTIKMSQSEQALKEVAVVGEKSMLEMSIDKKVFNVEKNITAAGGTAADVLQNIPSVTVDASGNVSLRGKGNVNILIDGRPATLLGGDVATALQSMPASSIESVELITNPSSKYDAQGKTGVINIITKTNRSPGINGSATLGAGTRDKYNGGINLNMRNNKWNFALNSNFRISNNYQHTTTQRSNIANDTGSHTYADGLREFDGSFSSFTVGYELDSHNTVSLSQNLNLMQFGNKGYQDYNLLANTNTNERYAAQRRDETFKGSPLSGSTNVNWKRKFAKPKQELVVDGSLSYSSTDISQVLKTNSYDASGALLYGPVVQEVPSLSKRQNFNIMADYSSPVGKKEGKLETGVKSQNFWFDSKNNATLTLPGSSPVPDLLLQNQYNYTQNTHAAYANYGNKLNKWSYQAGLRGELMTYNGVGGLTGTDAYSNSFLNLFPTAYLAYETGKDQQVYLNYSRRTDRPWFRQLMPYLNISNALDTSSGNPNLKPEFIDNVELAYNIQLPKGNNIMASIYFQNTNNLMQNFTKTYADGTSFSQDVNLNSGQTYGLELIGKSQLTKAWDATLSTNFFQNNINGTNIDPTVNNSGFSWFAKLNSNYKVSKQLSVQLMGNYESAKPAAQGRLQEVYWIDLALKGSFLKNSRASVTLNVTDIMNTRKYTTNYNLPLYYQSIYRDRETRIGTLTFTYKIGKLASTGGSTESARGRRGKGGSSNEKKKDIKERDGNLKGGGDDDNNNAG
ncbi:MAG: TonB-dependent receptor [Chitinophagaceae bacterium]|nr:TonB-dependent receptor [Chitinophagaceae bacterium]